MYDSVDSNALPPFYRDEHLFVDLLQQVVTLDGETLRLARIQHQVLALFVKHTGEVVPRTNLLMQIWRHVPELSPRQVDSTSMHCGES